MNNTSTFFLTMSFPGQLDVSADRLLFEANNRGFDDRLKLQFKALSPLDENGRVVMQAMIAGVQHMHDAKRPTQAANTAQATKTKVQKAVP